MSFGWSAGDIAAAITLIVDVAQALNEADGAAADYRSVSNFFSSLVGTLKTLQILSDLPASMSISLSDQVKAVREPVLEFQASIEKYKTKLGVSPKKGLSQHFRHIRTKLKWQYGPMKEGKKLQTRIGLQLQVLDTALLQFITWVSYDHARKGADMM